VIPEQGHAPRYTHARVPPEALFDICLPYVLICAVDIPLSDGICIKRPRGNAAAGVMEARLVEVGVTGVSTVHVGMMCLFKINGNDNKHGNSHLLHNQEQ